MNNKLMTPCFCYAKGSMGVLTSPFAAPGLGSPLTAAYAAGAGGMHL